MRLFEGVSNVDGEQECDRCRLPPETLGRGHEGQKSGGCGLLEIREKAFSRQYKGKESGDSGWARRTSITVPPCLRVAPL